MTNFGVLPRVAVTLVATVLITGVVVAAGRATTEPETTAKTRATEPTTTTTGIPASTFVDHLALTNLMPAGKSSQNAPVVWSDRTKMCAKKWKKPVRVASSDGKVAILLADAKDDCRAFVFCVDQPPRERLDKKPLDGEATVEVVAEGNVTTMRLKPNGGDEVEIKAADVRWIEDGNGVDCDQPTNSVPPSTPASGGPSAGGSPGSGGSASGGAPGSGGFPAGGKSGAGGSTSGGASGSNGAQDPVQPASPAGSSNSHTGP